jgi:hypothetical protein
MGSVDLIEPFAVNEVFVDGFTDFEVHDGILTCAGYRTQKGNPPIAVLRIVMPVVNLMAAVDQAIMAAAAESPATKTLAVFAGKMASQGGH